MPTSPARRTSTHASAVPELATEGLLARTSELARRWALALVMAREPARMGDVALDAIARDGPLLCEALLHAVVSDAALEQLLGPADGSRGPDPARTLALLSAARTLASPASMSRVASINPSV